MSFEDLLEHRSNIFSQNGEDGVIAALFNRIGTTTKACCEFGAWDGIHFSNCRALILRGWSAIMIESDEQRFGRLVLTYKDSPQVKCLNVLVDSGANSVGSLLRGQGVGDLDFLSVDIDGLDYEVFEALDVRPRVICIEVNAGHDPNNELRLSRRTAQRNIGQPLAVFGKIADSKGYDLACYTGNAFFVRRDVVAACSLPVLSCRQAYLDFLRRLDASGKEWLYLVNRGLVDPHYIFRNPHLSREALGIHRHRSLWLTATHWLENCAKTISGHMRRLVRAR